MAKTVADILEKLEEHSGWDDGEEVSSIRARLEPEELASEALFFLHLAQRGTMQILSARVQLGARVLFKVARRLPADLTQEDIELWFQEGIKRGYFLLM